MNRAQLPRHFTDSDRSRKRQGDLDLVSENGNPGIGLGTAMQMDAAVNNQGLLGAFSATTIEVGQH